MGIYNKVNEDIKEVDVIIAGGGTAACIVAGRLAKADPNLSILVIEGGTNNYNMENVIHPALFLTHLAPTSKTAIFYKGNKAKQLADREPIVPSGGVLGGGSSINFMLYTRAQRDDFDRIQVPGWSADDMWPYLKKLETYHGRGESKDHGYDGPVNISDGGYRVKKSEDDFIAAAEKVGYPDIKDLQNLETNNGFERWQRYVSPEGRRQDTAHRYLHPRLQDGNHPNLHVLVESKVLRVLFDKDNKACGIEYTPNPDYQAEIGLTKHPKEQVKARKMVIVSCGACGSPSVLERSGVGSKEVLQRAGVPLVADVPGVGHDYQDHNLIFYPYKTNLEPHETLDGILSGRLPIEEAIKKKNPILGWNTCDVSSKIRPTEEEVDALGPEFREAWDKDFKNNPNRPLMLMALVGTYLGDQSAVEPGQYVSAANYTAYPYSRGSTHITGPDLNDPLSFDVGFFTDKNDIDLKKQIWAYKKQREIMRRTKMYQGEIAEGHPRFPAGSKAACNLDSGASNGHSNGHANGNGAHAMKDLEYSAEDDAAIEQFLRENINTTWHSLGTNKMGKLEDFGAVDENLNVHGVKGLKVIDLSVMPENVAANTNNTALAIGEKGADIVARELGIIKPGEMLTN